MFFVLEGTYLDTELRLVDEESSSHVFDNCCHRRKPSDPARLGRRSVLSILSEASAR